MENGCKLRPNVQESTNVFELATFAYRARWEICFSHDDLARHENETILKDKSYNVRKIKDKEITHVTRRAGKSIIQTIETFPKEQLRL